jgi:flagellar motor switch protein FliM
VALREEIQGAEVEIETQIAQAKITLRDLINLKAGDIIPINLPKALDLCVDSLPLFRGQFGVHNGNNAVRITEVIRRNSYVNSPPGLIR